MASSEPWTMGGRVRRQSDELLVDRLQQQLGDVSGARNDSRRADLLGDPQQRGRSRDAIPPECWAAEAYAGTLASTEPAPKVLQRALAGKRRSGDIVGSSLIAIESVIGGVDEHLDLGVRRGEALDAVDR